MANSMKKTAPKKALKKPAAKDGHTTTREFEEEEGREEAEFNAEKFLEHVDNVGALKSKGATIRGQIGAAVKNAEEDWGIHRGAASLWIKLKNMNDDQRIDFLSAFDNMRTALGYATQTDLFDGVNAPAPGSTLGVN